MSSQETQTFPADPIITLERVTMRYGQGPEILSDIDLSLTPKSFTFLVGPSGAGKSTLLKLMSLKLKPTRGLIGIFGQQTGHLGSRSIQQLKRRIGLVAQDFNLIPHLNVFENVALPLRIMGQKRKNYAQDVIELLHWVGLGDHMSELPVTLSEGEKQRIAIARAVIAKPDLLLADEPTGNVDPEMAERLLRLFVEMNRMGTSVFIATHNLTLLQNMTADIFRLDNGQLHIGAARS